MALSLASIAPVAPFAADRDARRTTLRGEPAMEVPYTLTKPHRVGGIRAGVTNYGMFTGGIDSCTWRGIAGLEFPAGSGNDYLCCGAIWVGGIRGKDTLVSVGTDGWWGAMELWPKPYPEGDMLERTNMPVLRAEPNSRCPDIPFSPEAKSEQDIIGVYYDNKLRGGFVNPDPFDPGQLRLGLEITQKSYSWSFSIAQGFILFEIDIRNISTDVLHETYIGLYMDHDVYNDANWVWGGSTIQDDITGFLPSIPVADGRFVDTLNVPWIADADGDPRGEGEFTKTSPTGVAGVRILKAPNPDLEFSFNWWVSNSEASRDWGPNKRDTRVQYVFGNLGTPMGDRAKYQIMSNGEFDYDQVESAMNHELGGWLPPVRDPDLARDLADGFDTRYLLSFGPFELPPDSVLPLAFALLAAQDFHTEPNNFAQYFDPQYPSAYYEHLNFENLGLIAQWAAWVYDAPGVDTDGDGNRGKYRIINDDTVYYYGDGVPDFANPPPPPGPSLRFKTYRGKIAVQWNGEKSETTKDPFSLLADFEGYRVYLSRTGQLDDYALLTQRDNVNYARYLWTSATQKWTRKDPPFTLDSLRTLYDHLTDSLYGHPFHPDNFSVPLPERALLDIVLDKYDPSILDSNYYYFTPYEANQMVDDRLYVELEKGGREITGVIRKLYPDARAEDTLYRDDGTPYAPFYEYEYVVKDLLVAEPVFLAVTTFDFGSPAVGLDPIESSPQSNAEDVWPVNSAEVVKTERPGPGVYPNPYRMSDAYNAAGWENARGLEPDPERARKVTFYNVPDTCVVSIWSIDGDLVRRLEHRVNPGSSEASVVVWNLISRNTQAVKTGIYIYSIESRFGVDTGKLVIIK